MKEKANRSELEVYERDFWMHLRDAVKTLRGKKHFVFVLKLILVKIFVLNF